MLVLKALRRLLSGRAPLIRCADCGKQRSDTGPRFVAGPSVYICEECVTTARSRVTTVPSGDVLPRSGGSPVPQACSFCGKSSAHARGVVALLNAAICRDCLDLCAELFAAAPTSA